MTATRYVAPLREGGSLPWLMEADDEGLYVTKFRAAGQGERALVAEVVAGVRCVMFDFDGPLCPLYEGRPSDGLARTFHRILADAGLESAELSGLADPYGMLRRLPHSFPGRRFESDGLLRSVASVFGEHLMLEELERHLLGLLEETAVIEDQVEAAVRPYLGEEGEQRQKPGRRRVREQRL